MSVFRLGERIVDLDAAVVRHDSMSCALTQNEVHLLRYLSARPGRLVHSDELYIQVWNFSPTVRSRAIHTTTMRLRSKLEADPSAPRHLISIYGQGLRLDGVAPVHRDTRVPLFGQAVAQQRLQNLIYADHPWITVTGPPGVGKSTLVAETIASLPHHVIEIACQGCSRGELVARLNDALRDLAHPSALLVLDGCESHLDELIPWMNEQPRALGVQVLATSQRPLGNAREQLMRLPPLSYDAAIEMLVDRLGRLDAGMQIATSQARQIVGAIDRLPAAIDLAAERCRQIGPDALVVQLQRPLAALGGSMQQLLQDSFQRLPPDTRQLLVQASLFCAPFDLASLVGITGLSLSSAIEQMATLVDCSLVWIDEASESPYHLYHLVRDYARQALDADDPAALAHARWFSRKGDPARLDREQALASFADEIVYAQPDLRAAIAYTLAREPATATRCGLALVWSLRRSSPAEALAAVLPLIGLPTSDRVRVKLAIEQCALHLWDGDHPAGIACAREGLALEACAADTVELSLLLADHLLCTGEQAQAEQLFASLAPSLPAAGPAAISWWQRVPAGLSRGEAEERLHRALQLARRYADTAREADVLRAIASLHARYGDFDAARGAFDRASSLCTGGSTPELSALRLSALGAARRQAIAAIIAARRGFIASAQTHLADAQAAMDRLGLAADAQARHLLWEAKEEIARHN